MPKYPMRRSVLSKFPNEDNMMQIDIETWRLLVTIIVAMITAVGSGFFGSWVQFRRVKAELEKELASRLNERKWEVYTRYVSWTSNRINNPGEYKNAYQEFSEISADLALVASDKVLELHDDFYRKLINHYNETGTIGSTRVVIENFGHIVNAIRKDLGYQAISDPQLASIVFYIPSIYDAVIHED